MATLSLITAYALAAVGILAFLALWKRESRRALLFTPFLIYSVTEILRNWPAGVYAVYTGVSRDAEPLILMVGGYMLLAAGMFVSYGLVRQRQEAAPAVSFRDRPLSGGMQGVWIGVAVMAALLTAAALLLYRGLPPVTLGLRSLIAGESLLDVGAMVGQGREEVTKGHIFGQEYRGQGILMVLTNVGWPYVGGVALAAFLHTRSWRWLAATGAIVAASYLFIAGAGSRGPFMWSLVFLLVVYSLLRKVPYRAVLYLMAAFFTIAIGLSVMTPKLRAALRGSSFLRDAVTKIATRVLVGNGINTVHVIELVRDERWELRLGGVHEQRVASMLPGVSGGRPVAYQLYRELNPRGTATTYLTGTYIGDLYLDFGSAGVLVAYGLIGLIIGLAQQAAWRLRKTVLGLPLIALVLFSLGRMATVGPTGVVVQLGVTTVVFAISYAAARVASSLSTPAMRKALA